MSRTCAAQHIRIEMTGSMLRLNQSGGIYVEEYGHPIPLYYTPISIRREVKLKGAGLNVWYSLNFGKTTFEKFAYGVETGISINEGAQFQSIYPPEKESLYNIRVPLLFGFRTGAAKSSGYGKYGFAALCGAEVFKTSIGDEYGTFIVPKIVALAGRKRLFIGVSIYPFPIKSVYMVNGVEQPRLKTSLFEIQGRIALDYIPKRYRSRSKKH